MKSFSKLLPILLISALITTTAPIWAAQHYLPNVESLQHYQPPQWYQDAKFGIWCHWGLYSVPAYRGDHAGEWYGRWMYCVEKETDKLVQPRNLWNDYFDKRALKTADFHRNTYGDPHNFGYHQFADLWKAQKWDPDLWAQMAVDAGARFFCMMGMHHDSFALYGSKLTRWNAVDMGPHRDLCLDMKKAAHARGLKFGVSNHMAWNYMFFNFYHNNKFSLGQEDLANFYSNGVVDDAYLKRWWDRTRELAEHCQPDLYYFDWGWHAQPWIDNHYHEKFAAFFYNLALDSDRGSVDSPQVVLNSKFSPMARYCVRDLERSKMASIQSRLWQTDTSISVHSWGYSADDEYYSTDHLIDTLMDIISKNGILMLNFGPRADGSVPRPYYDRLKGMGQWLAVNGEAVYATRPWQIFGEGPAPQTSHQSRTVKPDHTTPLRFTRSKDNQTLYATALAWPGPTFTIRSLTRDRFDTSHILSVRLLGTSQPLSWTQDDQGLNITMPPQPDYGLAFPIRIQFTDQIPPLK